MKTMCIIHGKEGVDFASSPANEGEAKNVKVMLDTFHMNIEEQSIGEAIRTACFCRHFMRRDAEWYPERDGFRGEKYTMRYKALSAIWPHYSPWSLFVMPGTD